MPDLNTLLDQHVTLVYESVDRIFLNGYVAKLQEPDQLAWFLCQHRGEEIPRYELLGKMTREFVAAVEQMAQDRSIPVVNFEKGQRKETVAEPYFADAALLRREGVVLVGVAQEKAKVFGAPTKKQRQRGRFAATRRSAYVKHYYLYIWDRDFGPTFINGLGESSGRPDLRCTVRRRGGSLRSRFGRPVSEGPTSSRHQRSSRARVCLRLLREPCAGRLG